METIQPTQDPIPGSAAPKKKSVGLTYGLIGGLIFVVLTALLYLGGVNMYLGGLGFLGYLALIIIAVLACLAVKKSDGGYLSFQNAIKISFTVFVISLAMQTFFNWLLLEVIDTNFKNVVAQEVLVRTEKMLRGFGLSDDKIDEAMKSARNTDQYTIGRMAFGLIIYYIPSFVVALIIAAIVKKKKPEFADPGF